MPPSRITTILQTTPPAFIPFIMAGHPTLAATRDIILELATLGADIIELGVPYSDPCADGIINQRASEIALSQGVTLAHCLQIVTEVRAQGCTTPIVLFSYFNPIFRYGLEAFAEQAQRAKIDSVLVVDLPVEEADELYQCLQQHHIGMVFLASPTTVPLRLRHYQRNVPDFLYYVSRLGVTGIQKDLSASLADELATLKTQVNIPICVGFGISTPEQAAIAATSCAGVIMGSALVSVLENSYATAGIKQFVEIAGAFNQAIKGLPSP